MSNDFLQELLRLFHKHTILDLPTIQSFIPNRSRCSLFRDLRQIDYLSCYNKAGRYYTLRDIPQFDESGLWKYCGVYFSTWGSLKNTAKIIIDNSFAGHTHLELQNILDVRVHNTLLDLVSTKEIGRELFRGSYLYTHINYEIREKQLKERVAAFKKPPVDPYLAIEVLRAVIKFPEKPVPDIQHYLNINGIKIGKQEIEDVFEFYDLGKKNSQ